MTATDTFEDRMRKFRRTSGMARFERECRLTEADDSRRKVKAYRVPGTPEHGRHHMFLSVFDQQGGER